MFLSRKLICGCIVANIDNFLKKSVSRATLYQTSSSESENDDDDVPDTGLYAGEEFDFVEIDTVGDKDSKGEVDATVTRPTEPEFELFPLFSTGQLTEVDLRSSEGENLTVTPTRPDTYYFARYSPAERLQFSEAALAYDDIIKFGRETPYRRHRDRVLNVNEYNAAIDRTRLQLKSAKRRRPGKRQRLNRKLALENIQRRLRPPVLPLNSGIVTRKKTRRGGKKKKKTLTPAVDRS